MRALLAVPLVVFGFTSQVSAQVCTGLCTKQVACPAGQTTSISGTVYAPNGLDPLPNVTVYIPNAPVDPFTPGVTCPVVGTPPSGSPLVGATTGVDGTFKLVNAPVDANIPLVIVSGRWRRQLVVPGTTACTDTAFSTRFPRNQSEGDIPKIAVATGNADQVECVLRKVGVDDAEFTNPSGTGRINLYSASGAPGARIDSSTPSENVLMGSATTLDQYDVLMLPCEGGPFTRVSTQLANLIQFANAGGRVYASHYSYVWMYNNPPFSTVANWAPAGQQQASGVATVDTTFTEGQTLAQWLQIVGATTTKGQMDLITIRHDIQGVNKPTQSWLTLNNALGSDPKPVMQFVFDTPVGAKTNQCGRVLFNEYHVENTGAASGTAFPAECTAGTSMTPQEKLLEFSLFELTDDGSAASLDPASADFGSQAIGFATGPQTFTWTNNSTFSAGVSLVTATGDFIVTGNNCAVVSPGGNCQITVVFKPTALGPRTGTLSVGAGAQTLTADLTGIGVPDLTSSPSALDYGSIDVGASLAKTVTITNNAAAGIPLPPLVTTGDFSSTTNCPSIVPALSTCTVTVTFRPTTSGPRTGNLGVNSSDPAYAGLTTSLKGNGVDFTLSISPTSGQTVAGITISTAISMAPLAGFSGNVSVTCTSSAPGSTCGTALNSFLLSAPVSGTVNFTTTPKYTVIGYGGIGGAGLLSVVAMCSAWLLWIKRRSAPTLARAALVLCFFAAASLLTTGCSGKLPALNPVFTPPGNYTYTISASDGTITHTATYTLTVTAK